MLLLALSSVACMPLLVLPSVASLLLAAEGAWASRGALPADTEAVSGSETEAEGAPVGVARCSGAQAGNALESPGSPTVQGIEGHQAHQHSTANGGEGHDEAAAPQHLQGSKCWQPAAREARAGGRRWLPAPSWNCAVLELRLPGAR